MCDVIALTCIVIFFQILMYKIGCKQGEKTAYKRFLETCNYCRNKKMNLSEKLTCSVVAFFATVRKSRTVEERG